MNIRTYSRLESLTKRGIVATLSLVIGLAVMTGIAVPKAAAEADAAAAVQWGACPPPPEGIPDAGMQCATVLVPLDYRAPNGRKSSIKISRVTTSQPGQRRGVLFSNPGGPGGAGLDLPRLFSVIMPQEVLHKYDLIGFDPRGVDQSSPVSCGLTAEQAEQAYVPLEQNGNFSSTAAFMKTVADSCDNTDGDVLPFMTTANTARDMERIRQALAEPKIAYLGYSYGTYLGAVYASLFPTRTDRFVLDSSVNPDWVWRAQFRSWGPGGDIRFPDFATFAAANNDTYHLGNTPAKVRALFFKLVNQLNQDPMTLPDGTVLNGPMFREITFGYLYDDVLFPDLASLWQTIQEAEDGAALQQVQATRPPASSMAAAVDNFAAAGLAVTCGDVAWPRLVAQYRFDLAADSLRYPLFGPLGSTIWPCAFWASQPVEQPVRITPTGPKNVFIVQNRRDPATPYQGALGMHAALGQRSRLLSIDQGGHAAYLLMSNTCANDTTTAFLANGTFPTHDVSCPAEPTSAFAPQADSSAREQAMKELQRRMGWQ